MPRDITGSGGPAPTSHQIGCTNSVLIGVGIVYWAGIGLVFLVVLLVVILVDQGLAQARTWVLVLGGV
jgi:hypothetical protein